MRRRVPVDPAGVLRERVGVEPRRDRPGLDERDADRAPPQLEPQRIGVALDGVLGRAIGAAPAHRREAEHRGALHDPPMALRPHRGQRAARQRVPADEVRLEDRAHGGGRHVLEKARNRVSAVVEQRVEPAARARQNRVRGGVDRRFVLVVEPEALEPLPAQARAIRFAPAGREHAPAARGHGSRGVEADAGGASGDQDDAAAVAHRSVPPRRFVVLQTVM